MSMQYGDDLSDALQYRLKGEVGTPWHKRKEHPRADQIAKLRGQGYSVPQIAKAFKVHRTTIFRRMKEERLRQEAFQRQDEERRRLEEERQRAAQQEQARREREWKAKQERLREVRRRQAAELEAADTKMRAESKWRHPFSKRKGPF